MKARGLRHFQISRNRQISGDFYAFSSLEPASASFKNTGENRKRRGKLVSIFARPGLARRTLPQDGFTLIEALIGVALMGLILSLLAAVTANWIPNWRAGFARIQTADLAGLALDRLTADIAAAEFIAPIGQGKPLFYGSTSAVTFVRSPLGPKPTNGPAPTGLEIIRFADSDEEGGLVRSRIPFAPESSTGVSTPDFEFSDSSLLLRAPFKVTFGFAGPDRIYADDWSNATALPSAVRISVRNANSGQLLAVSTATLIHVNAPAACVSNAADAGCVDTSGKPVQQPTPSPSPTPGAAPAANPGQPAAGSVL